MIPLSKRDTSGSRPREVLPTLTEETALILWIEDGHKKPWALVAESTKERFRRLAEKELGEVFCSGR